jgi:hypothetical protein
MDFEQGRMEPLVQREYVVIFIINLLSFFADKSKVSVEEYDKTDAKLKEHWYEEEDKGEVGIEGAFGKLGTSDRKDETK